MSKTPDSRTSAIDAEVAVKLSPVAIPKPWGQEIWYTGIEARGESQVEIDGNTVPLSDYLASVSLDEVLLLKVLDPSPTPVLGDLYVEVHEEKREVYVVTAVDSGAWPDGSGKIRFGLNQALRGSFPSDEAFRSAYLDAIQAYENVRRAIDEQGQDLEQEELETRAAMEAFSVLEDLEVGDVVTVPTWTPHSLQHGVRVVEFQTPVYERLIVSFAQEVVTQDHWDSKQAVERMHLDPPESATFEQVAEGIERVARFEDFNVWRVRSKEPVNLPADLPYAVVMNLSDTLTIGDLTLDIEEAALIPKRALTKPLNGDQFLIAAPGL